LKLLELQRAELSILLAGPQKIRALNRQYRGVDSSTDVMAFPIYESPRDFPEDSEFLLGDVVINPSQAQIQALEQGITLKEELRRLMVHGLLHLVGFEHGNASQRKKMLTKEQKLLDRLKAEDNRQ
jgi:probable rRNA maturation factor